MILLMVLFGQIVWEYRTTAPAVRTYPAIGAVVGINISNDSCIYVIGGQSAISQTRTNYEYSCQANAWTTRTQMPLPIRYDFGGCSATRAGVGRIYVMGGYESAFVYYADVDEFTPSSNTWVSQADMPTAREGVRAACVGNMVYAIGGDYFDGVDPYVYDVVERYNPETNTWTTGYAAMPTARTDACCTVAINENGDSCIYVFGGSTDIVSPWPTNAIEEYNPATNTWRVRNSTGSTGRWGAMAVTAANRIYVIGGTNDGSTSLNLVEVYNPATNTWSSETPVQQARDGMTGGVVGGRIYAVVGSQGNTIVNTNERTTGVIGIEEIVSTISGDFEVTITPNPAQALVRIQVWAEGLGQMVRNSELQIYDVSGMRIKSFPNASFMSNNSVTWQCDNDKGNKVPAGIYFVQLKTNDKGCSKKVIVLD